MKRLTIHGNAHTIQTLLVSSNASPMKQLSALSPRPLRSLWSVWEVRASQAPRDKDVAGPEERDLQSHGSRPSWHGDAVRSRLHSREIAFGVRFLAKVLLAATLLVVAGQNPRATGAGGPRRTVRE